ncbi:MAG TPA: hypothetical protein PKE39_02565 [Ignavibacteria bacterium]|nr:hypothetical protein [Ignavibacteria bacterium]HMQ97883.1 hypothetical protein [Ignavibacteria bacterium]
MKTIIIVLIGLTMNILSQDVTVSISANKSEYQKIYSLNENTDPIILNYTLHNNTADSILIKFEPFFELTFIGDGYKGYSHCFRLEPIEINGEKVERYFKYNQYSSFVKVAPNDSLVYEGEFDIFWPCRSAPPWGDWKFNLTYRNKLTKDENYFLVKGRYTDFTSKEFIKAWEGELVSNTISFTILRDK